MAGELSSSMRDEALSWRRLTISFSTEIEREDAVLRTIQAPK